MNLHHPSNLSVDLSASDPQLVTTDENAALVAWINPPSGDEFAMTENPLADAKLLAAAWNAFVSAGPELGLMPQSLLRPSRLSTSSSCWIDCRT
jgi:hypothetical protein